MWPFPLQVPFPGEETVPWGGENSRAQPWEETVPPSLLCPPLSPRSWVSPPLRLLPQQINFIGKRNKAITVNTTLPGVARSSLFIIPN